MEAHTARTTGGDANGSRALRCLDSGYIAIEGVRCQVDAAWPCDGAALFVDVDLLELSRVFPESEHTLSDEIGQVYFPLDSVLKADPDSVAGSSFSCFDAILNSAFLAKGFDVAERFVGSCLAPEARVRRKLSSCREAG